MFNSRFLANALHIFLVFTLIIGFFAFSLAIPSEVAAASQYSAWVFVYKWGWIFVGRATVYSATPGWRTYQFWTIFGTATCQVYWNPRFAPYHTSTLCSY